MRQLIFILIIGFLSGLSEGLSGAGWGVLSLILLVTIGVDSLTAVSSSILVELILGLENNLLHFQCCRFDWKIAGPLLVTGCLGVFIGARHSTKIPEQQLRLIIGILVIIFGLITTLKAWR